MTCGHELVVPLRYNHHYLKREASPTATVIIRITLGHLIMTGLPLPLLLPWDQESQNLSKGTCVEANGNT